MSGLSQVQHLRLWLTLFDGGSSAAYSAALSNHNRRRASAFSDEHYIFATRSKNISCGSLFFGILTVFYSQYNRRKCTVYIEKRRSYTKYWRLAKKKDFFFFLNQNEKLKSAATAAPGQRGEYT